MCLRARNGGSFDPEAEDLNSITTIQQTLKKGGAISEPTVGWGECKRLKDYEIRLTFLLGLVPRITTAYLPVLSVNKKLLSLVVNILRYPRRVHWLDIGDF